MMIRIVAAAVALVVAVPILAAGPVGVWALVGFAGALCVREYAGMAFRAAPSRGWVGVGVPWTALWLATGAGWDAERWPVTFLVSSITVIGAVVWTGDDFRASVDDVARSALGLVWLGPLVWLVDMSRLPHGPAWLALPLAIAWASDTGGYFAGVLAGRTPLHPRVSPKKTVEGAVGSVFLAAVAGGLVQHLGGWPGPLWAAVGLGGVGAIFALCGDLFESLLKRAGDVKDSGAFLPGHGGMLDRIDSVLFVVPWVYMATVGLR